MCQCEEVYRDCCDRFKEGTRMVRARAVSSLLAIGTFTLAVHGVTAQESFNQVPKRAVGATARPHLVSCLQG